MSNNVDEKVIQKIRKLLALGSSSNEHEAQSAMLKAQQLIAENGLKMKDIKGKTEDEAIIDVYPEFIATPWKKMVAKVLADNFRCKTFIYKYTQGRQKAAFIGFPEDVAIVIELMKFALKAIAKGMDKCYDSFYLKGLPAQGVRVDYALGFIKGLKQKFEEQKAANQEWGLVLVTPEAVVKRAEQELEGAKVDKSNRKLYTAGNQEARQMGYEDGKQFSVGPAIE